MDVIVKAVGDFFNRYPTARTWGNVTSENDIEALPTKVKKAIPGWYIDLLFEFPIANLPLGIPSDFGQPGLVGRSIDKLPLMELTFFPIGKIAADFDSVFPDYFLKKEFIGIAQDSGSTGEKIFMDTKSANPSVMLVFHDMGESMQELLQNGIKIADRFSDLFVWGKLTNDRIVLTDNNREVVVNLIAEFFSLIDAEIKSDSGAVRMALPDVGRLEESLKQRDHYMNQGAYISALLKFQYGLYDSGYPVTKKHLDHLIRIYEAAGLHLPELVYFEERIG